MIIIIERKMLGYGGHEATQIEAIENLVPNQKVITLVSKKFSKSSPRASAELSKKVVPLLRPVVSTKRHAKVAKDIDIDVANIIAFLKNIDGETPITLIIPTAGLYEVQLVIKLHQVSKIVFPTHIRIIRDDAAEKLKTLDLTFLRKLIADNKVFFHTETMEASDWVNENFDLNCRPDFLLACTLHPQEAIERFIKPKELSKGNIKVGYLGGLRGEKGKMLVPDIIRELRKIMHQEMPDRSIEFIMPKHRFATKFISHLYYELIMAWKLAPSIAIASAVKIVKTPSFMPPSEFLECLETVDVLVVPYSKKHYRYRGSGIVFDGVLALKPIVYTRGVGGQEYVSLGNAEAAEGAVDFAQKIMKVIQNLSEYRDGLFTARAHVISRIEEAGSVIRGKES